MFLALRVSRLSLSPEAIYSKVTCCDQRRRDRERARAVAERAKVGEIKETGEGRGLRRGRQKRERGRLRDAREDARE